MKCIGVKLKLLVFFFVPIVTRKVQKLEACIIYRVIPKQRAKRVQTHLVYLHAVEKYEKVESINTQND